jgi:hypothetical protein
MGLVPGAPGTLTLDADTPQLVLSVMAPQGPWQASVVASGALATVGGETATVSFTSDGQSPSRVFVPLTVVVPVGEATVHVIVGDTSADFSFSVVPASDMAQRLCVASADGGGCDPGFIDGSAADASCDPPGTSPAMSSCQLLGVSQPATTYFAGESVNVLVDEGDAASSLAFAEPLKGTLATTGSISLVVDAGLSSATTLNFEQGIGSLLLPAVFTGAGEGTLDLRVGRGAQTLVVYASATPVIEPRRVQWVGSSGSISRNLLTVCTSAQGTLSASLAADGGALASSTALIQSANPSVCPPELSLAWQASFLWSGSQSQVVWQFSVGDGGIVTLGPISMIVHPTPKTTCLAAGAPQLLAWAIVPPPPLVSSDSGAVVLDAGPGTLTVDVRVPLYDCSMSGDPDAGTNPAYAGGNVSVQATGGLTPTAASVSPDPQGRIIYELTGPAVSLMATAVLTAPGGGTAIVAVSQP